RPPGECFMSPWLKGGMLALAALAISACSAPEDIREVVVYTSRGDHLVKPVFDAYTAETGVAVRYITDNDAALLTPLEAEGSNSPADLLITVDAGNLWQAAERGLLQPVENATLQADVPAHLRDPENRWFGLSIRARTLVYSTERVQPAELSTYEALAD